MYEYNKQLSLFRLQSNAAVFWFEEDNKLTTTREEM